MTNARELQVAHRVLIDQDMEIAAALAIISSCEARNVLRPCFQPLIKARKEMWQNFAKTVGGYECKDVKEKNIADDLFDAAIEKLGSIA